MKKCLLRSAQGGTNETEECIKGCKKSICQENVQGHPVPVRVPRAQGAVGALQCYESHGLYQS